MIRVKSVLFAVTLSLCVIFLALDVIQPWKTARLCIPLQGETWFTSDNRIDWGFRIGTLGGVNGFKMSLSDTDQDTKTLRAILDPLPFGWWRFHVSRHSPFFLLEVPPFVPAMLFGLWPSIRLVKKAKRALKSDFQKS